MEYTCLSLFQDESVDRFRLQLEDLIFELLVVDDTMDEACPELVLELTECALFAAGSGVHDGHLISEYLNLGDAVDDSWHLAEVKQFLLLLKAVLDLHHARVHQKHG